MKKFNKYILALFALTLSACGGNNNSTPATSVDNNSSNQETSQTTDSSSASGKDEIKNPWWETTGSLSFDANNKVEFEDVEFDLTTVVAGEDLASFREIITEFNNEYRGKINVTVNSIGQDTFENTVSSQISNNVNAPDLIMSHQKGHMTFKDNKLIQPFDEAMEKSGIEISMNDYADGLTQYTDLGQKGYTFGVPIDAQSNVVYYNKTLLNKYGGEIPANRSELFELCKKVKAGEGITPIAWVTNMDFFRLYVFGTAIAQNGGYFYNTDDYYTSWYNDETNRTAFKNAIKSIREVVNAGYAEYDLPEASATTRFVTNKALFFVGMPWNANSIFEAYSTNNGNISVESVMKDRIGATSIANWFALTDNTDDGNKIFGDSHFFAMSKTVKNIEKKAAILEFMKWYTQTGSIGAKWAEAGHITASTIIANDDEYASNYFVNNYINLFYPDINYFQCAGNTPFYEDTFNSLGALFTTAKAGTEANDESYIKQAQDAANEAIEFLKGGF